MANLVLQLRDFRLTTPEILHHMPDHPGAPRHSAMNSIFIDAFPAICSSPRRHALCAL